MINYDVNVAVAEIYESLGDPRAPLARANADQPDPDLHDDCTDSDALAAILHAVPDAKASIKHSDICWQTHAACLRDKIYNDLGRE